MLNINLKYSVLFVNIIKVAKTLEQDIFVLDADSCYANENMESSNADVDQTTCTSTRHIETMTQDKEVQVQPFIKKAYSGAVNRLKSL
jgi:hypothetical protein